VKTKRAKGGSDKLNDYLVVVLLPVNVFVKYKNKKLNADKEI